MKEFDFTLKFAFSNLNTEAEDYVELLGQAGCDDALIGIGKKGRIAFQFCREAKDASEAILTAIKEIKSVIPDARLVEATPDLVGLSDIAELLGFSRQNIRKLIHSLTFPEPIHEGKFAVWHLAKVLQWFEQGQRKPIEPSLMEIANANMQLNIAKEFASLEPQFHAKISALIV
ncbi:MAG: DNA-binding protein [Thiomargarita sp.]|nr:DNA-binding protein [Thiomargarita sp.]